MMTHIFSKHTQHLGWCKVGHLDISFQIQILNLGRIFFAVLIPDREISKLRRDNV